MKNPDYYLVIDLEATCGPSIPKHQNEIIEIGAVMVARDTLEVLSTYQAYVCPKEHPHLDAFCVKLTTIQQSDVDGAPMYPGALDDLMAWANQYPRHLFCSWGNYDRTQFNRDCIRHGLPYPLERWYGHINLKVWFGKNQRTRQMGVQNALTRLGMTFEGTQHRGIDDAINIARLLPHSLPPVLTQP